MTLLLCIVFQTTPCRDEDLNLNVITTLKEKYKSKIGYSGHESSVSPTYAAWFLGADYIERHITLDRTMYGTDQAASLSEQGIRELIFTIKISENIRKWEKKISVKRKKIIKKFRYWK